MRICVIQLVKQRKGGREKGLTDLYTKAQNITNVNKIIQLENIGHPLT